MEYPIIAGFFDELEKIGAAKADLAKAENPSRLDRHFAANQKWSESKPYSTGLGAVGLGAEGALIGGLATGTRRGALAGAGIGTATGAGLGYLSAVLAQRRRKVIQDVAAGKAPKTQVEKYIASSQVKSENPALRMGMGAAGLGYYGYLMGPAMSESRAAGPVGALIGAGVGAGAGYLGSRLARRERKVVEGMEG